MATPLARVQMELDSVVSRDKKQNQLQESNSGFQVASVPTEEKGLFSLFSPSVLSLSLSPAFRLLCICGNATHKSLLTRLSPVTKILGSIPPAHARGTGIGTLLLHLFVGCFSIANDNLAKRKLFF